MNVVPRTALLPVASVVLAGCGLAVPQRPPADLGTWSLTPLPPDPALAAEAIGDEGVCRFDDPAEVVVAPPPQILVQDRRTADTAAFLVVRPQQFGHCLVTRAGGASGSGGPLPEAMTAELTIDVRSTGVAGNESLDVLGGRVAFPGAQVVLELHDGQRILASTANGYWLTWRPAFNGAKRLVAIGAEGVELGSIEVPAE